MRALFTVVMAAMLLASPALRADTKLPLPAGKPAGVRAAELDVTDTVVIATTAAILVTAVVLGITQKGYSSTATAPASSP